MAYSSDSARNSELARPVSEYCGNSAGPVCSIEGGGGRQKWQRLKRQLVSKKMFRLTRLIHHRAALESPFTVYSGSRAPLNLELVVIGDSIEHAGVCIGGQGAIWGLSRRKGPETLASSAHVLRMYPLRVRHQWKVQTYRLYVRSAKAA